MNRNRSTAVLLIAHGSRRAEANRDLAELAEIVRSRQIYPVVEIGYLELAEPSIPAGARGCVRGGIDRVLMLPYFLSYGAHVVDDLERYRHELAGEFPGVEFIVCPPLGLHPQLVDVVFARLEEGGGDE